MLALNPMKIDGEIHDTLMDSASLREGLSFEEEVESDGSDSDISPIVIRRVKYQATGVRSTTTTYEINTYLMKLDKAQ